jgi:hypothetical protein
MDDTNLRLHMGAEALEEMLQLAADPLVCCGQVW